MGTYLELRNNKTKEITLETLQSVAADTSRVHFVGLMAPQMPGVDYFAQFLEYRYFPPLTAKNKEYRLFVFEHAGLIWYFISIPTKFLGYALAAAEICGVLIYLDPPLVQMAGGQVADLPLWGETIFGLVYLTDFYPGLVFPDDVDRILAEEAKQIKAFQQKVRGTNIAYT